jgi:hypothetical protein
MAVSPAGLVTWAVPAAPAERECKVLITVSDRSGQEAFHAFALTVEDAEGAGPPFKGFKDKKGRWEKEDFKEKEKGRWEKEDSKKLGRWEKEDFKDKKDRWEKQDDPPRKDFKGKEPGPAVRFEVPSPIATEIRPPALEAAKVVRQLPATIGGVAVGGGGRYLILHLPKQRQLALFDVNEAKVVHHFPLAEDTVKFAAGGEKLVIRPSSR